MSICKFKQANQLEVFDRQTPSPLTKLTISNSWYKEPESDLQ